jgi:transcriptional regulator with XRE-family HTH domain
MARANSKPRESTNDAERIAQQLKAAMKANGWKQDDLVQATGVGQSQVSVILSGRFVRVSRNVKVLCQFAGITPAVTKKPLKHSDKLHQAVADMLDGDEQREKALLAFLQAGSRLLKLLKT